MAEEKRNILETIADCTRERVADHKERLPLADCKKTAEDLHEKDGLVLETNPFYRALLKPGISFICEIKRASPSKGLIAPVFPYLDIAREYTEAGADAISVLTEPRFFQGSDDIFREIRAAVRTPMIRKDFTVDEYMIYEAKTLGADAVLLIVSLLGKAQLQEYLDIAHSLGLAALVEAHDETEIQTAVSCGAHILGVNNRNLKDFTVDIMNSVRLRKQVPADVLFVSESGMKTRENIETLESNGVNAVLIGETLMRSRDKAAEIARLRGTSVHALGKGEGEA
ncbi:MAG: indole-3-glycerol phosphate synthase TrpC [Clostridia bacterium]|nr:indole-3-glycerol phosphate synthase TrpC [Clostridia bacterium]